jgi:hypothetical protein
MTRELNQLLVVDLTHNSLLVVEISHDRDLQ